MTARLTSPSTLIVVPVLVLSAMIGALAVIEPKYAVAGAIGVAFMLLVVADVTIGLCLFVAATFLDEIPSFSGLSVAKGAGALLVLSWLAAIATHRGRRRSLTSAQPLLVVLLGVIVAWTTCSALWAGDSALALGGAQRWALNVSLFPIVYTAVRDMRTLRWVFGIFVAGGLLTALATVLGLAGGAVASEGGRLSSESVNPNALGGLLVTATIFAAALASGRDRTPTSRAGWYAAASASLIFLALTLSRGALVGMAVAFMVWPIVAGRGRRVVAMSTIVTAVAALALAVVAFVPAQAAQRLTDSDGTGSGRTDIWRVGWRMVQDHALIGVGADNFAETSIRYLVRPGVIQQDEFIVNTPKVAHNVYLQVLAELGIIGLLLYLLMLGVCLRAVLNAAWTFDRRGDRSADLLARALLVALVANLASAFFSSQLYSKPAFLMLALGPAALRIAREERYSPQLR